jgi:CheY-like chemotaxis protein
VATTQSFRTGKHVSSNARPEHATSGCHTRDPQGCVLLVDGDRAFVEMLADAVGTFGLDVVCALGGREALALAHRVRFDVLLLDLDLWDVPALDVVRGLRDQGFHVPFIVLTRHAAGPVVAEATALGALAVLEEPIRLDALRAAVARAWPPTDLDGVVSTNGFVDDTPSANLDDLDSLELEIGEPHTPCERWRKLVLRLITSPHDLKTNGAWARCVGVSRSVLCESCRRVHLTAQDSRNFARMVRALLRSGERWVPEAVLDCDDIRTLRNLEKRSGLTNRRRGHMALRTPTLQEFFAEQNWIAHDNPALLMLQDLLLGTSRARASTSHETNGCNGRTPLIAESGLFVSSS